MISLIWAMSENRVIGQNNRLPWRLPADMRWFRQHTLGKPIVMGRNTYESFGRKALPERQNIILSREPNFLVNDADIAHTWDDALRLAGATPELMVIGGASIYRQALPMANRLYMTLVHTKVNGDSFFPDFDRSAWIVREQQEHPADEKNPYPYSFLVLER